MATIRTTLKETPDDHPSKPPRRMAGPLAHHTLAETAATAAEVVAVNEREETTATLPIWENVGGDRIYAYENIDHLVNLLIAEVPKGRRERGNRASLPLTPEVARDLGEHLIALADRIDADEANGSTSEDR